MLLSLALLCIKYMRKYLLYFHLQGLFHFRTLQNLFISIKKKLESPQSVIKFFNVKYNSLLIFDDTGISGLSPVSERKQNIKTQVLDWFDVNLGSSHDIDYMRLDDEFIKDIFFYESKRPHVYSGIKDLVAISHLTPQEAKYEYQYSDTYARFKILKCLKKAGIRGAKNGKNPNYPQRSTEPFKWLSPKITFAKREIVPFPMLKYRNTKKIKFCYDPPEKIISENTIKINTYTSKLLNIL